MTLIRRLWRKAVYNASFVYWTAPLWIGWLGRWLKRGRVGKAVPTRELGRLDLGCQASAHVQSASGSPIRLVSWNICYGCRLERILEVMRELGADIYLLQEVDRNCGRSGRLHVAQALAGELSLNYVFGVEFQELAQQGNDGPAFHGQAILSRFEIRRPRLLRFRSQPADWSLDSIQPRIGGRMALFAEIAVDGHSVPVYNAHLENRCVEEERAAQFRELLADASALTSCGPTLIAGDLNTSEHGSGRVTSLVSEAQQAGFHRFFCRWKGDRRTGRRVALDWVFSRGMERIKDASCSGRRASDHSPVCIEFEIP